jgi:hypothetical protein
MTPREFVLWMQGFVAACNDYTTTPKQWDELKEKLQSVVLDENISYNISTDTYTGSSDKTLLKD